MKAVIAGGLCLISVSLVLAGGAPRKEDMPKYIKTLTTSSANSKAKVEAADMIAKRGAIAAKDVEDAVVPLKYLAQKDSEANVRSSAVHALGAIAPEPNETVPILINILKNDKSVDVKFAAINALGRYGPQAKAALPVIRNFSDGLDKKDKQKLKGPLMAISGNR